MVSEPLMNRTVSLRSALSHTSSFVSRNSIREDRLYTGDGDTINECDYDADLTKLYSYIESKKWDDALQQISSSPREASIWIYRKQKSNGKVRWRLLPIHAAIIFNAPEEVIELLLIKSPQGAQSKDDQGALPLHLAIRNKSSDVIVTLLLMTYPKSIEVRDRKNRLPLTLAQLSPIDELRVSYVRALQNATSYFKILEPMERRSEEERLSRIKQVEAVNNELAHMKEQKIIAVTEARDTIQSTKRKSEAERSSLNDKIEALEMELARAREYGNVVENRANQLEVKIKSCMDTERLLTTKIDTLETKVRDITQSKERQRVEFTLNNKKLQDSHADTEHLLTTKIDTLETKINDITQSKETQKTEFAICKETLQKSHADTERLLTTKINTLETKLKAVTQSTEKEKTELTIHKEKLQNSLADKIDALEIKIKDITQSKEIQKTEFTIYKETLQKSHADTERLLANKVNTLETKLKDVTQSKERQKMKFMTDNEQLKKSHNEAEHLFNTKITTLENKIKNMVQLKEKQRSELTIHNEIRRKEKVDVAEYAKTMADEIANLRHTVVDNHVNQLGMQNALASAALQSTEKKAQAEIDSLIEKIKSLNMELTRTKEHHANQLEVQAALSSAALQSAERNADAERLKLTERITELERTKEQGKHAKQFGVTFAKTRSSIKEAKGGQSSLDDKIKALDIELIRAKEHGNFVGNRANQLEADLKSCEDAKRLLAIKIDILETKVKDVTRSKEKEKEELVTYNATIKKEKAVVEELAKTMAKEITNLTDMVKKQDAIITTQRETTAVNNRNRSFKKNRTRAMDKSASKETQLKAKTKDEPLSASAKFFAFKTGRR